MRGLEAVPNDLHEGEVDLEAYTSALSQRLAVSGLSILRYGARLAARSEDVAVKIAKHGDRAPVAPDLPELHGWLKQATTLRLLHERHSLQGPVASDQDIVALLARIEPLYEDADRHYNG